MWERKAPENLRENFLCESKKYPLMDDKKVLLEIDRMHDFSDAAMKQKKWDD